jgi:hypothetical protein
MGTRVFVFGGTRCKRVPRAVAAPSLVVFDSMRDAHGGLGIMQVEFYDLVQLLRDSMVRHGTRLRERNELLGLLAPMKRDIVEK